jgi:hypothetical protein
MIRARVRVRGSVYPTTVVLCTVAFKNTASQYQMSATKVPLHVTHTYGTTPWSTIDTRRGVLAVVFESDIHCFESTRLLDRYCTFLSKNGKDRQ